MRNLLNHYFESGGIEKKILSRGIALALVPLLLVTLVTLIVQSWANSVSVAGCFQLATQDLNHTVQGLLGAGKAAQEDVAKALDGAKVVLDRAGSIDFDASRPIDWKAKNQLTNEVVDVNLPTMLAGVTRIRPIADFSKEAPIVDQVQQLFKMTATVFQRMNEQGDMLRIATTVKKASGERAIGTFIPANGPDGKPNVVVSTVLKGKTYLGRAFVVNAWFMAAYRPITDSKGRIVGMIYAGLPETDLRDKLARFNAQVSLAGKTDVFALHTAAQAKGLFVLSNDKTLEGHDSWNVKDPKGNLFVQEICRKALEAKPGEISQATYWSIPSGDEPSRKMIARFTYYPEWDWVIGVQQPEEDFMASPNRISRIFQVTDWLLPLLCLATGIGGIFIWRAFVGRLSSRIASVAAKLVESSSRLAAAARSIGERSGSVARSSRELMSATQSQAAAAEETSAATSVVTATANKNSQTADQMRSLSSNTESVVKQAVINLEAVDAAMQSISATSGDVLGIVDSINEIGFATNIVALNASIEAARAGAAGITFGFIAGEVRSLAGKCSEAADQTKVIVNQSRSELERGSLLVSRLVGNLQPVSRSSDRIRELASEVSTNSQQQADSLRQVLEAVEQIQQASDGSAKAAQKGAEDASALQSQVDFLIRSVSDIDQAIEILNKEFEAAPPLKM